MNKLWIWHAPQSRGAIVINVVGSVVRLAVAVFALVFVIAGVSTGTATTGPVGALWVFLAGAAAVAGWIAWDVLKSWGRIPAARVHIDTHHIAFSTPFWQRSFMGVTFKAGEPMSLSVREVPVIPAGKTMHIYEFSQGDAKVRYFAPMCITEDSVQKLTQILANAGTQLKVPYISR